MKHNALLDQSLFSPSRSAWPSRHPENSTECVFMGRAIHELARAKFGDTWTGEEPNTQLPDLLPDALEPSLFNALAGLDAVNNSDEPAQWFDPPPRVVLERADDLLAKHRPGLQRPSRFFGMLGALNPRALYFTIREWKIAQELAKKERNECLDDLGRWFEIQKEIVTLCERGVLESVTRPQIGGDYSPVLTKAIWRTERYQMRFLTFLLHPEQPFSSDASQISAFQWIFFTRKSLQRAIAILSADSTAVTSTTDEDYKSELMQHMQLVVRKLSITRDNQPKKEIVSQAISDLWKGPEPLSKIVVKYMATMIRMQETQGGRNKRPAL